MRLPISKKVIPYLDDINRDRLVSQEDIVNFFDDKLFDGIWAVIINGYGENQFIVPTLSFFFHKNGKEFLHETFSNSSKLKSFIETELGINLLGELKDIGSLVKNLRTTPNIWFNYDEEVKLLVITKSAELFKIKDYPIVETFLFLCKRNSLNLLNSSYDFTIKDLISIEKVFSKSIAETARNFRDFFRETYNLQAYVCTKSLQDKNWVVDKDDADHFTFDRIIGYKDLIQFHKPIYLSNEGFFFLILPFCNDKRSYFVKHILIIESAFRIPKYIVTNFLKFVNNYFNAFIEKAKRGVLSELQLDIIAIQNDHKYVDKAFNPIEELSSFAKRAFVNVIELTNAFSATLRFFNPSSNSLNLIAEAYENSEVISQVADEDRVSIPLSIINSINVQTFQLDNSKTGKPYIHIPDMTKRGAKAHRVRNSLSEICFPFRYKGNIIGTVNFESGEKHAFDADSINYIGEIINLLQNFYISLFEKNDKLWLYRKTQIYQNYHEIENIITDENFPEVIREQIQPLIRNYHISLGDEFGSLHRINAFKDEYFNQLRETTPSDAWKSFYDRTSHWIDNGLLKVQVKKFVIDTLLVIYKNILTNQNKFGPGENDKIYVQITPKSIKFNSISSRVLLENKDRHYLICPFETVSQSRGKNIHYGLFIIGMLTRQLGGYAYIFYNQKNSRTHLNITIPMQELWMKTL